jgi:hypothetical protein
LTLIVEDEFCGGVVAAVVGREPMKYQKRTATRIRARTIARIVPVPLLDCRSTGTTTGALGPGVLI